MKWFLLMMLPIVLAGCVRVEGGDKPIKIDMTVTLKVDQQLDQFYSFQDKQPATVPTTNPGGGQ